MKPILSLTTFAAATLIISMSGCGGAGDSSAPPQPVIDNSGVRGTLIETPPPRVLSLDTAGVSARVASYGSFGTQLAAIAGAPACGIDVHHFEYATVGAGGEKTTASGALMVPTGSAPACSGARPIVLYGHGSSLDRQVDMADVQPSATYGVSSIEIAALYAAQGYVVVAPNYAGYDTSTLTYHPYQIADQQAKDMLDALAAARKALPALAHPVADSGRLFLTGHSEGGYATMATQRALQTAGIAVTAAAPSSGRYAESLNFELLATPGALDDLSRVTADDILYEAMQFTSWQKAYGNLYVTPADIYPAAYAATIETLAPSTRSAATLVSDGQLPPFLLSNDEPDYPQLSPAQQAYFGTPAQSLVKTSLIQAAIADIAANPCPVTSASAPLQCTPANPLRTDWLANDLRTWTPTVPVLMCGGHADGEVPFVNTTLAQAYFQGHGGGAALVALDVDSPATAGDPWAQAKATFVAARAGVVAAGEDPTTNDSYHGFIVQAACAVAARDFFKTFPSSPG